MSGIKKVLFCLLAVLVGGLLMLFVCGCAGVQYQTPCNPPHLIEEKEAKDLLNGKSCGEAIECPVCGTVFPAELLTKKSRHTCDGDEVKWYHGFGWHWTGPYGYHPYSHYGYGGGNYYYRQYHYSGCECDRCRY